MSSVVGAKTAQAVQGKPPKAGRLAASWMAEIGGELEQPYMRKLKQQLLVSKQAGATIFPPGAQIFNALNLTAFDQVKVVILGQDPYHGPGQAHGLSFSVPRGIPPPPSLKNIFKEIESDLGIQQPRHGYLEYWARQGVLLLNAVLTVEASKAASHKGWGWENFTDAVIASLQHKREGLVYLLWGSAAQRKGQLIDRERNLVLTAPHPSPLSAHRGFLGCKHFSATNNYLVEQGRQPIDWSLPDSEEF